MAQGLNAREHLWVNEDSVSLLKRSSGLSTRIRSHVEIWSRRQRTKRKPEREKGSAAARKIALEGWSKRGTTKEENALKLPQANRRILPPGEVMSSFCQPQLLSSSFAYGDSHDPFGTIKVKMNQETHDILQYFLHFAGFGLHRAEFLVRSQPAQQHRSYLPLQNAVHESLADKHCLYALLAVTAAKMSHIKNDRERHQNRANKYMGWAVRNLRLDLTAPDPARTKRSIMSILHIAVAQWNRGDHETSLTYMNVLKSCSQGANARLLEKDRNFDPGILGPVDVHMAAEIDRTPIFPMAWDFVPLSRSRADEIDTRIDHGLAEAFKNYKRPLTRPSDFVTGEDVVLQQVRPFYSETELSDGFETHLRSLFIEAAFKRFGRGLLDVMQEGMLCDGLNTVIAQLVPSWADMMLLCVADRENVTVEEATWIGNLSTSCLHQLLSLRDQICRKSISGLREESLRLTLIMILSDLTSPIACRSVWSTLLRLKGTIQEMETRGLFQEIYCPSPVAGYLSLWILIIAMCAASTSPDIDSDWFACRALRLASHLKVYTIEDMSELMRKFFYCDLMRHPCVLNLMGKIARQCNTEWREPTDAEAT